MNSLHVDTELTWRGGERQVLLLIEGLIEKGHTAYLAANPRGAIIKRARSKRLPDFPVNLSGPLDIFSARRLARFARKEKIRIVHLHTSHACAIGPWIRRFYPGVKLVASRRVDFPIRSVRKYKKMDAIIAISSRIRDILIGRGITGEKIHLVHSGVPLPALPFKKDEDIMTDHGLVNAFPVVGNIAHLADHKGHIFLLEAAKKLQPRLPEARFLIIGEGEKRPFLEAQARRMGLLDQVIFTGFREDVYPFMTVFDIFVLPSHLEGLGTSLLDAMGFGIPVVASRTGGIPDVIDQGENGRLVPPADPDALAAAIEELAGDEQLRRRFGENGRRTIESRFSIGQTVEKTLSLYNKLIE